MPNFESSSILSLFIFINIQGVVKPCDFRNNCLDACFESPQVHYLAVVLIPQSKALNHGRLLFLFCSFFVKCIPSLVSCSFMCGIIGRFVYRHCRCLDFV